MPKTECAHALWREEGDGHGHNYWQCAGCGITRSIAPWLTGEFRKE